MHRDARRLRVDHAGQHRARPAPHHRRGQPDPLPRRLPHRHLPGQPHQGPERSRDTPSPRSSGWTSTKLITIGGDDTAYSAMKLEEKAHGRIQVVHVPKTIDNDLDLPRLRRHLRLPDRAPHRRRDRQEPHGRRPDHVALVLRHRHGPQGRPPRPRHRQGGGGHAHADPGGVRRHDPHEGDRRHPGRCASSSGSPTAAATASRSSPRASCSPSTSSDLAELDDVERDAHGHVRIAEVDIGEILKEAVQKRLAELGPQDHHRGQEHRLRAALRRPHPLRHGVHPRPRLLRHQVPALGRQRRHGLDAGRPVRAGPVRRDARSRDRADPGAARSTSTPPATRSPAAT